MIFTCTVGFILPFTSYHHWFLWQLNSFSYPLHFSHDFHSPFAFLVQELLSFTNITLFYVAVTFNLVNHHLHKLILLVKKHIYLFISTPHLYFLPEPRIFYLWSLLAHVLFYTLVFYVRFILFLIYIVTEEDSVSIETSNHTL